MTGTIVIELRDATHHLNEMISSGGAGSLREHLLRGPSINKVTYARALSDFEKELHDVVSRIRTVADKGIGKEEEQEQVVASSKIVTAATDLLKETRSKFRIHEYPSGLPFLQKAIINVKRFFGFFTRTRYVEIATVPVDVKKVSSDVHAAVAKEFAKGFPQDFEKEHRVSITLTEKKVEGPQEAAVFEVTDQGELRGKVEGQVVQASTWIELGKKIDAIRGGFEAARANRAALVKDLDAKVLAALPSELPDGSWYIRKKRDDVYVFCLKGQPQKEAKITNETTAKNINELFGVDAPDNSYALNVLWDTEKHKLDQRLLEDEVSYAKHGQRVSSWVAPNIASASYFFVAPGEQAGEKEKASLRIGVRAEARTIPLEVDDSTRTFKVHIDGKECSASTFDDLQKQILAVTIHGEPLRHINYVIPIADKNYSEGKKALDEMQRVIGGEFLELTQETAEREMEESPTLKGLAKEGMIVCQPWKGSQDSYFLTVLQAERTTTLPLDVSTQPGKIILRREIDKGGDIVLWPQAAPSTVKDALKAIFGVKDALFPLEFTEIRQQVGPLRDEILKLAGPSMEMDEFSKLVRVLGENAKNAFLMSDVLDRSVTIHWWDGKEEKEVVVDLVQNPGRLTVGGKPPYPSVERLLQGEIGVSKASLIPHEALGPMAAQLQEFVQSGIVKNSLYLEKDLSKNIMEMIHRVGVPQVWWIADREAKKETGILEQVVGAGKWVKGLVIGEKESLLENIERKYCVKVCMPEGDVEEIPLLLVFGEDRWQVTEEGGERGYDTIEALIRERASELGIDAHYSYPNVHERLQRHLAVEKEIESSGVGAGKIVLKRLAGLFAEVFSYKYYQGEIADPDLLLKALAKEAVYLKHPVGCVFKLKDQNRYQLALCNKEGQCRVLDLEIDSKTIPGQFGLKGGKKFDSFAAFKDEVLKDVLSLTDAENSVKRAIGRAEIKEEQELPGPLPQPPLPEVAVEKPVAPPEEARPLEVQEGREVPLPARPDWLDLKESWVTVGKGKRLDKDIRKLMENVEADRSLVSCEPAGSLNTDERAFHAWVKALGGASEKLGAQDLEKLEDITRDLPLLERFWLFEVVVNSKIISGHRQERAMHALEHCLKANIKPDEQRGLLDYLAAHAAQYGNARTKEDAVAFLKGKVQQ